MSADRSRPALYLALNSGLRLGLIAAGVVGALAGLNEWTREPIAINQQRARVATLIELTGDPRLATTALGAPAVRHVRLCEDGQSRYRLIRGRTRGYAGAIEFVIALSSVPAGDPEILGVRVTRHSETPGLGDAIESDRSDWILGLGGHPSTFVGTARWAVRQDGGEIDALSGATITSRAVLTGIRTALTSAHAGEEIPCTPLG